MSWPYIVYSCSVHFVIGLLLLSYCSESSNKCSQSLSVDTYSVATEIAIRDAAAIRATDDTLSILADIAGCDRRMSYDEVTCCRVFYLIIISMNNRGLEAVHPNKASINSSGLHFAL